MQERHKTYAWLWNELETAFKQDHVVSLSTDDAITLQQHSVIERIAHTFLEHSCVENLLRELKEKLPETHYYHSLRVGVLFRDLTLQEESLDHISPAMLDVAGILHDAGKKDIPREILEGGELSQEQRRIVQVHIRATYLTLQELERDFFPHLLGVALYHHNYPRTGNERRQEERRMLELALEPNQRSRRDRRSVQRRQENKSVLRAGLDLRICDMFDAWGSKRSYKQPMGPEEIRQRFTAAFPHEDPWRIEYLLGRYGTGTK